MSNKINQVSSSKNYGDANIKELVDQPYRYGFRTNIETEEFPKGLSENIIRLISEKRYEPSFMLDFRLRGYKAWMNMSSPEWACIHHTDIDYQNIVYYSVPKIKEKITLAKNMMDNI